MSADFSTLIDTLLVLAGLVLVVTGLVMFIYSKTSTQASSVEAFGIKLNVTHPSLILVLAGVGLMLAPRLLPGLPGLPGQPDKPEPATVAEAAKPDIAAPTLSARPETAVAPTIAPPPASAPASQPTAPAADSATATARPAAAPPAAASPQAVPATKPRIATPAAMPTKPAPRLAVVRPAPASTAPVHPEAVVASPPVTTKPVRPMLVFAALGLPVNRTFWSGETRASYTRRMHTTLQQAGRDVLRIAPRGLELGQAEFDAWWDESDPYPRSRELCAAPDAPYALLSARVETPITFSSIESAYWPELKLRLFVCATQRLYRQQKTLSPQRGDAWPFAIELNSEIERFLRTYRADMQEG